MTYERRSTYEYGDPVMRELERDEARDHARAGARGQRLLLLADEVVSRLMARAVLPDPETARADIFSVLADHLYGGGVSIDVPCFRDPESLDRMRRGRTR